MLSKLLAKAIFVAFLLCVTLYGGFVAGVGLHEPDTCFLLALGRWIVQQASIPKGDPFSFTYRYVSGEHPFVVHQWLTDVVFYMTDRLGGATLLIVLTAGILTATYVVLCSRLMVNLGLSRVAAISLCFPVMIASMFVAQARPEIFTLFFCALTLNVIADHEDQSAKGSGSDIDWRRIVTLLFISILWANFHTGYVLVICLLGLRLLVEIVFCVKDRGKRKFDRTWLIALPLSFVATLINPYGAGLWLYLPHHFFNKINATINELQPLNLKGLAYLGTWVFILLAAIFVLRLGRNAKAILSRSSDCFFIVAGVAGISAAAHSMRMYSVAYIFLMGAIAVLSKAGSRNMDSGHQFWQRVSDNLAPLYKPERVSWQVITVAIGSIGCFLMTLIVPAQIPNATRAFTPPLPAIAYMEQHPLRQNLLNDPHFGDVIMWHLEKPPLLFVDSRYDVYSLSLMDDYWTMYKCQPGWQGLLRKYGIESIFLPPSAHIIETLKHDPAWVVAFADKDSVILEKIH
jgi:hypothetical protein